MRRIKPKYINELAALLLTAALLAAGLYQAGIALMPGRDDFGSTWGDFLQEDRDSIDVLFFGSSMVYCDVCPGVIYDESGLTSYVMAGPEQTMPVTLAYVRETLRTQSPEAIVVELTGLFFDEYTGFSKVNVCYMPFGLNRIRAARACEKGLMTTALFPLYDFHSEVFPEPGVEPPYQHPDARMLAGYTPVDGRETMGEPWERTFTTQFGDSVYSRSRSALEEIAALCERKDVRLICYFAPCYNQVPALWRENVVGSLDGALDLSDLGEVIGADKSADWYDVLHFNQKGAARFSAWWASYLTEQGVAHTHDCDQALWQQRADYFRAGR